jgi:DNA-binding NarL/FixJ family response regulator
MNSLDLQERLVADRPAFPIIFITAHDDEPTRLRVRRGPPPTYPSRSPEPLCSPQSGTPAGPA